MLLYYLKNVYKWSDACTLYCFEVKDTFLDHVDQDSPFLSAVWQPLKTQFLEVWNICSISQRWGLSLTWNLVSGYISSIPVGLQGWAVDRGAKVVWHPVFY